MIALIAVSAMVVGGAALVVLCSSTFRTSDDDQ